MRKILILITAVAIIIGLAVVLKKSGNEAQWSRYHNAEQGFEIMVPRGTKVGAPVSQDPKARSYEAIFYLSNAEFRLRKNLNDELTPLFPSEKFCQTSATTTIGGHTFSSLLFSEIDQEGVGQSCPDSLKDHHSVDLSVCMDLEGNAYPWKIDRKGEHPAVVCENNDDYYNFSLLCSGTEWSGINGQKACSQLFEKLLSTFRMNAQ